EEPWHRPDLGLVDRDPPDRRVRLEPVAHLPADAPQAVLVRILDDRGVHRPAQYQRPQRYHLVLMYFVPRTTGLPAWSVHGLGTPSSSALFQISSVPGRGATDTPRRGNAVAPPSSTALR